MWHLELIGRAWQIRHLRFKYKYVTLYVAKPIRDSDILGATPGGEGQCSKLGDSNAPLPRQRLMGVHAMRRYREYIGAMGVRVVH